MLAWKKEPEALGLKIQKKGKFKKRTKDSSPPVEAPYVPPKLKRAASSSLSDRTVEIFEGMTTVELAKRCGVPISVLQDILINVGEKVDSEYDPLSIDISELIAMVNHFFSFLLNLTRVSQFQCPTFQAGCYLWLWTMLLGFFKNIDGCVLILQK